jgi:flagellar assembly factor FliW
MCLRSSDSLNAVGGARPSGRDSMEGNLAMLIETSRFGTVQIEVDDILLFPNGLFAFAHLRHWVLLADAENDAVGWLQSASDPQVAVAVVSPRRFVPHYQVRVTRSQLASLDLSTTAPAYVLTIVSKEDEKLTVNLKAPVIVNLERRLGKQVVSSDEQPLQHVIVDTPAATYRRSA